MSDEEPSDQSTALQNASTHRRIRRSARSCRILSGTSVDQVSFSTNPFLTADRAAEGTRGADLSFRSPLRFQIGEVTEKPSAILWDSLGHNGSIKRNLARLDKVDQLLVRLLASTGMRLSEAFEFDVEEKERGVRYVVVDRRTDQSLRRVPLPAAVLPYLPKSIKGPLVLRTKNKDPSDAASKRLNRFLDDCGITDPRKLVHSLRHRVQDRLPAAGCLRHQGRTFRCFSTCRFWPSCSTDLGRLVGPCSGVGDRANDGRDTERS